MRSPELLNRAKKNRNSFYWCDVIPVCQQIWWWGTDVVWPSKTRPNSNASHQSINLARIVSHHQNKLGELGRWVRSPWSFLLLLKSQWGFCVVRRLGSKLSTEQKSWQAHTPETVTDLLEMNSQVVSGNQHKTTLWCWDAYKTITRVWQYHLSLSGLVLQNLDDLLGPEILQFPGIWTLDP